ncbi:MAG: hypothetical protein R3C17_12110 [Planctomycetaceae bacterium]
MPQPSGVVARADAPRSQGYRTGERHASACWYEQVPQGSPAPLAWICAAVAGHQGPSMV